MALLSVADALARVIEGAVPVSIEQVPLNAAEGRVLAEDLLARRTQPPEDLSAMDGYAVRAADVANAPARLKLIGESLMRQNDVAAATKALLARNIRMSAAE